VRRVLCSTAGYMGVEAVMLRFSMGRNCPSRSWRYLRSCLITTLTAMQLSGTKCLPQSNSGGPFVTQPSA